MLTNGAPHAAQRTIYNANTQEQDRDRFFQTDRCMLTRKGQELTSAIVQALLTAERDQGTRQRRRKPHDQVVFERTVEAIICDLSHAELTEDYRGCVIPRAKDELCTRSPYRPWYYGHQLPDILDLMVGTGVITQEIGSKVHNQRTLVAAGDALIKAIAEHGIRLSDIGQTGDAQTIVLKDHDGSRMAYNDDEQITRWRHEMMMINDAIAGADIRFDHSSAPHVEALDVNLRRLRRVFIQASFKKHGRLTGGFWIGMKKYDRLRGIRIDDQSVTGLDYGQTVPRIAYGLVGVEPPEGDLYLIPGLEDYRTGIKKFVNAMLNHDKPFSRKPSTIAQLLPPDLTASEIQDRIRDHLKPIAHMFGTGAGLKLMFHESEVMVSVLLTLIDQGIVALPVHDCIIIREDQKEIGREVMIKQFEELVGVSARVDEERYTGDVSVMDMSLLHSIDR
jgi:hypothetical protein